MVGFVVAALSMVGIPPTAGFFSKLLVIRGTLEAGAYGLTAVLAASSVLTAFYVVRLVERLFGGEPHDEAVAAALDRGVRATVPILILTAATVTIGLGNVTIQRFLDPVVTRLLS